jgi:DNA helicase-2/ATP-dependent DNA helicase PcrA
MHINSTRPLKVFLSYSPEDKDAVNTHYQNLLANGIDAWFKEENLLPGQERELEVPKAARDADAFIIFLSNKSINQEGYFQKEIKIALDIADEKPEGIIYIIPTRLEDCILPARIGKWQWVDLFSNSGFSRLMKSLALCAKAKGLILEPESRETVKAPISSLVLSEEKWSDDLSEEQIKAASYHGSHARLLAGPGTGKTLVLTRRIVYLIQEKGVNPDQILALTFTRAATTELKQRVSNVLGDGNTPRISTLHSFALRQLLRNSKKLITLPKPLRIADDWEERHIIFEDIRQLLKAERISHVTTLFSQLSADWESLVPEEHLTPPPQFIASWRNHRKVFGYSLRSELVYQLKRSLEQISDFELEHPFQHLLIDEYQDLNKCDLSVVKSIESRDRVEVFAAGDDDQSIYYFRKAHPEGIRNFHLEYEDTTDLLLTVCKRCDSAILGLAEFVASLDIKYTSKGTKPEPNKPYGQVKLLNFDDQEDEAGGIARICKNLIDTNKYKPEQILVLLRTDRFNIFSKELIAKFQELNIPIVNKENEQDIFETEFGRQTISVLRLLRNLEDHLAWRTLLQTRKNGFGQKYLFDIYDIASEKSLTFYQTILSIINGGISAKFAEKLKSEYNNILSIIDAVRNQINIAEEEQIPIEQLIDNVLSEILKVENEKLQIQKRVTQICQSLEISTFDEIISAIETSKQEDAEIEQDTEKDKVNILTMHKAKGLTADVVFIVAAEDEIIPGKYTQEPELGDERRLLFVSLTRAKHELFITYCAKRTGAQQRSGRDPNTARRHLTQFLSDAPLQSTRGQVFINKLENEN